MLQPNVELVNGQLKAKPKRFKFIKPKDDIDKAIQAFLSNETGKFSTYVSTKNALVYRNLSQTGHGEVNMRQDIVAIKIERSGEETIYLGNSSILPNIGRSVNWGNERLNRSRTEIQTRLSVLIPMLPFGAFIEAGLDLFKTKIIEQGPEETVTRTREVYNNKTRKMDKVLEDVHFTGASVFNVEDKYFLFDIDRREVKHKIFNPFIVELVGPVSTVKEAYESLKPQEVKDAESKGLEVKRQGEWFFIPLKETFEPVKNRNDGKDSMGNLRASNNRPNYVSKYHGTHAKIIAVSGIVEHSGREHAKLMLKGWYKPVPNTSVKSFTITGDVD